MQTNSEATQLDGFWGWMRDVTALAGDLMLMFLVAGPDKKARKKMVFQSGDDPTEQIYFAPGASNDTILLYNTTSNLTCACTFSMNDPLKGLQVSTLSLPPSQTPPSSVDVTSLFQQYQEGGWCALTAASTSTSSTSTLVKPAPDGGGLLGIVAYFFGIAVGASVVVQSLSNLKVTWSSSGIQIQNNSNVKIAFRGNVSTGSFEFTIERTLPPGVSNVPFPDSAAISGDSRFNSIIALQPVSNPI